MTLQPTKKRPTNSRHKKRSGHHHRHNGHYLKTYWPYLPVIAVLAVGVLLNSWLGGLHRSVLGYATDMSIASLVVDTNQQRAASGEGILRENTQLDQAAQTKANDMAARDYWSHNTPDGQAPWTFIANAGYSYQTAGENLAYGFATAADTLTGWMNSPGHRANILNTSFSEVGFGFVNIANYQGSGPQTLVVAMYASPYSTPVATATPTPPQASSKPATPSTNTAQSNTSAAPSTSTNPVDAAAKNDTLTPATNQPMSISATVKPHPSPEPKTQALSRVQLVSRGQGGIFGISAVILLVLLVFAFRHFKAWHRVLVKGESFVLHHPGLDAVGAAVLVICLMLIQTSGLIK